MQYPVVVLRSPQIYKHGSVVVNGAARFGATVLVRGPVVGTLLGSSYR